MESFGERIRPRAIAAGFSAQRRLVEGFASLRMPRQVSEDIVAALQRAVPEHYTLQVTASGRGLLIDSALGTSISPVFGLPVIPGLRTRSVVACAEAVMAEVEDFVTDHEGSRDWLDPGHLADEQVEAQVRVHDGHLHMTFRAGPAVIRVLDPVRLPEGWK